VDFGFDYTRGLRSRLRSWTSDNYARTSDLVDFGFDYGVFRTLVDSGSDYTRGLRIRLRSWMSDSTMLTLLDCGLDYALGLRTTTRVDFGYRGPRIRLRGFGHR
jgi:hypothetical protein